MKRRGKILAQLRKPRTSRTSASQVPDTDAESQVPDTLAASMSKVPETQDQEELPDIVNIDALCNLINEREEERKKLKKNCSCTI
jgi:hypothetical protein